MGLLVNQKRRNNDVHNGRFMVSCMENEQDMPETKLARLKFQEQMEKLLSSADWREAEPLWNQCASAFEYQGFLMGFRTALRLLFQNV